LTDSPQTSETKPDYGLLNLSAELKTDRMAQAVRMAKQRGVTHVDFAVEHGLTDAILKPRHPRGRGAEKNRGQRDTTTIVEGKLCSRGHATGANGGSLRYASSRGHCVECRRLYGLTYNILHNLETHRKQSNRHHKYYWTSREKAWATQGMRFRGGPMTREVYWALRKEQHDACALCHSDLRLSIRGGDAVDHNHETKEVRGILCGAKQRCNLSLVSRFEAGKTERMDEYTVARIATYLLNPPASRLTMKMVKP
jgi:recombination endonuclease VII